MEGISGRGFDCLLCAFSNLRRPVTVNPLVGRIQSRVAPPNNSWISVPTANLRCPRGIGDGHVHVSISDSA